MDEDEKKEKLRGTLADQAEVKKQLSDLEENWLEKLELIECFAQ